MVLSITTQLYFKYVQEASSLDVVTSSTTFVFHLHKMLQFLLGGILTLCYTTFDFIAS